MRNRLWMVTALCAMMGAAGMTACSDDTNTSGFSNFLKVDHPSYNFDDTGDDPFSVIVTYTDKNGNPVANQTINATSKKVACAGTDKTSEMTDATGRAKFDISPATLDDCRTTIVFSASGANDANVKIQVGDGGGDTFFDGPTLEITVPSSKKVTMTKNSPDFEFKAVYVDTIAADIPINFKVADESCVMLTNGLKRMTDSNGVVSNSIKAMQDECRTTITLMANNNESISDVLDVIVTNATEYNVNLQVTISDENVYGRRLNDIQILGYLLSSDDPSMVFAKQQPKNFDTVQLFESVDNNSLKGMAPILYEFKNVEIALANNIQSIVVIAKNNVMDPQVGGMTKPVIGYAAIPVSMADAGQTLVADLKILPNDITGKYHVISNFDFSSAFEKTTDPAVLNGNKYPRVEEMDAGDWVAFATDFFEDATTTLIEFTWINTISRIADIPGISEYQWVVNLINGFGKTAAIDLLRPILLCYVDPDQLPAQTNEQKEEKRKCKEQNGGNWAQIFSKVAPDVSDLITNMQFSGNIDIPQIDPERPTSFMNGKETFDTLLVNWSLGTKTGSNVTCIGANDVDYYYVKKGENSCRIPIDLTGLIKVKKMNEATGQEEEIIESAIAANETWNGTIAENVAYGDGILNIPSHGLKLYWLSIFVNALVGNILPNALGYNNYNSVAQHKHYILGFFEYFVFRPFVNKYIDKAAKDETLPKLTITDTAKTCDRFIESLIYSIAKDNASGWGNTIGLAANLICTKGFGALDEKVISYVNSKVIVTDNGMGLKSDACTLYAEGTGKYQKLGKPDDNFYTAKEIVNGSQTNRCTWDLGFKMGESDVAVKGYYHGTRIAE